MEYPQLIPDDRREDMLTGAIEGGSNYWYYLSDNMCDRILEATPELDKHPFVARMWAYLKTGKKIVIRDIEDKSEILGKLSIADMSEREFKMAKEHPEHFSNILTENDDAETADVWLQYVLMNSIVYG